MVMDKSGSFSKDVQKKNDTPKHVVETTLDEESPADEPCWPETAMPQVLDDVDKFLERLSFPRDDNDDDDDDPHEAPGSVEVLFSTVEKMIAKDQGNDGSFLEMVSRVSELSKKMGVLASSSSSLDSVFNKASTVLHKSMSFLEEEFRTILEDPKPAERSNTPTSAKNSDCQSDRCALGTDLTNRQDQSTDVCDEEEEIIPAVPPESLTRLAAIAGAMFAAGYSEECVLAYEVTRRGAFKAALEKLGHDGINIDDVQRMQWEPLQHEVARWVSVVKGCSSVLFPLERSLSASVFSSIGDATLPCSLFRDLSRSVTIKLLGFAEAVVVTKPSAEKLFKLLDMYEALRDLEKSLNENQGIDKEVNDEGEEENEIIVSEVAVVKARLREAVAVTFGNLENSIKNESEKTPIATGTVHPLTRYVMNYLEFTCSYKDTLEQVFEECPNSSEINSQYNGSEAEDDTNGSNNNNNNRKRLTTTPFGLQLETVMDLLDANLEAKSKLYRDVSLCHIFMMNNGRYIVQKIKASSEIHQLMGDTWCRKRSSELRQHHKNYQRETWGKVLQCLNHEGLQVNGKVSKPVLKERFKSFNATLEEIHKTQSAWKVSDEQLQSELRVSVSAVMIPAYRSFLGRFKQYLDSGRQTEKYIKYQPEDIETMIDELFDGRTPVSIVRRRN